jgi:negative regulator of flagellin synthesis FlgM
MKVNNGNVKGTQANAIQSRDVNDAKKTKGQSVLDPATLAESSKVNVSTRAQDFQKAKAIASADTIDEAKVARLQKLIDEGKYKVDAQAVADKMVDEHLLMSES